MVNKSKSSLSKNNYNCKSSVHLVGLMKKPITNAISKDLISRSPIKINKNLSRSEIKSPKGKHSYKTVSSKPSLNNPSMSEHLSNKMSLSKCTSRQLIKNFSKEKIVEMNSFWKKNINSELNSPTRKESVFEINSLNKNCMSSIQLTNSNNIKRNYSEKGFKQFRQNSGCNDMLDNLLEKYFENRRNEVVCNIEEYQNPDINDENNDFTLSPGPENFNKPSKSQEIVFIKNKYKNLVQKYC
jgi:hypothetical protein